MSTRAKTKKIEPQKQAEIEKNTKLNVKNDRLKHQLAEKQRQLQEQLKRKQEPQAEKKNNSESASK